MNHLYHPNHQLIYGCEVNVLRLSFRWIIYYSLSPYQLLYFASSCDCHQVLCNRDLALHFLGFPNPSQIPTVAFHLPTLWKYHNPYLRWILE